jgi:hypothetical protein
MIFLGGGAQFSSLPQAQETLVMALYITTKCKQILNTWLHMKISTIQEWEVLLI